MSDKSDTPRLTVSAFDKQQSDDGRTDYFALLELAKNIERERDEHECMRYINAGISGEYAGERDFALAELARANERLEAMTKDEQEWRERCNHAESVVPALEKQLLELKCSLEGYKQRLIQKDEEICAMTARAEKAEATASKAMHDYETAVHELSDMVPNLKAISTQATELERQRDYNAGLWLDVQAELAAMTARAEKAEAELARLGTTAATVDHYQAMVSTLEGEVATMKQKFADLNREYGCELRDPNGTIWEYCAELQKENAELKDEKDSRLGDPMCWQCEFKPPLKYGICRQCVDYDKWQLPKGPVSV